MNGAGQDGGENLLGGFAELDLFCGEVFTLGSLDQVESVDVNVLLLGETLGGARRRADGIVRHRFRRTGDFGLDVRLFCGQAANPRG